MKSIWFISILALGAIMSQHVFAQDDDIDEFDDEEITDEAPPSLEVMEKPEYRVPIPKGKVYFAEPFDSQQDFSKKWVKSAAKKDDVEEDLAKYDGIWSMEESSNNPLQGDHGLVLKSKAKHHAISSSLEKIFDFSSPSLYIQYEVQFQNGQDCGGAYIKLLSQDSKFKLDGLMDRTPYTIMFGPDKCGNDNKLHFIFRHKNPVTGEYEEKHAKKPTKPIDTSFTDKKTHIYTLVVNEDNTFEIFVDQDLVNSGSLLEDFEPAVNPPKEIVDPEDKKPEGWDEREKIPDPDAVKPEDWDESQPETIPDESATMPDGWLEDEAELIADPEATMPADWDEDIDGEWEAPLISNPTCESAPGCGTWTPPQIKNPLYKGKWRPEMIENPNYQGKWKARMIPNPNFFDDQKPYKMTPIAAVGLELWSMSNDIYFDNFIITDNKETLDQWTSDTWELKHQVELLTASANSKSVVDAILDTTRERPWLWAVFIVVIVLPIVLLVAYCCMSGSSNKTSSGSSDADAKKTDSVQADDEVEEDDKVEEDDSTEVTDVSDSPKNHKSSKSQLESEETPEEEEEVQEKSTPTRRSARRRPKKE